MTMGRKNAHAKLMWRDPVAVLVNQDIMVYRQTIPKVARNVTALVFQTNALHLTCTGPL